MKKIIQLIERYQMLSPGQPVVVGFSGGADSVTLLHFLFVYGAKVTAVHVNHGLRGAESDRDERFAEQFCARLGVPLIAYRVDAAKEAKQRGMSVEQAGRLLRYEIFEREAKRHSARIATAHTLSDQAETVLFRLARGSGLRGLCGIPPVRAEAGKAVIIRPLLEITREEVEAYCSANGLSYVTDSSNLTDDYARNKLRHQVVPVLREINERAEYHCARAAAMLLTDADYLDDQAKKAYESCKEEEGLSAQAVLELHPAISSRVWRLFFAEHGIEAEESLVRRAGELLQRMRLPKEQRYGEISIPRKARLILRKGELFLLREPQEDVSFPGMITVLLEEKGRLTFPTPCGMWCTLAIISRFDTKHFQKVHKNLFYQYIDYDIIKGNLVCRGRREGDHLVIAGRNVGKSVKKWMNEEGISLKEREKRLILADDEGVLLVERMGVAKRAYPTAQTKRVLTVSFWEQGTGLSE